MMKAPSAQSTVYLAGDRSHKPTIRVTAITHRNDPILRGTIEGAMPGSYSENAMCSSIMRAATAWNVLDRAGVPGITDVWCPPVHAGINLLIQMQQSYRNQAKQAANAVWGSSAAHVRYKHITVVDDDIDIHDYAAVDWAVAHRVNAGENDVVIMPATFGMGIDPSVRKRDRNPTLFGTGKWNRVLIDATMNLDYDPDPDLGAARFPHAAACTARGTRSMDDGNGVPTEIAPMTEEAVTIPSAGLKLSGVVHVPRALRPSERRGAFLVLHGFGSNKTSSNTMQPTKVLNELGYVVLRFDMRGCGDSEGEFGRVICLEQVEDTRNALSFLAQHPAVDPARIGLIGSSFGGAVAIYAAGVHHA